MTQPTDTLLAFATDATFVSGPADNVGEAVRVTLAEAEMAEGLLPGVRLRIQHLNSIIGKLYDEAIHRRDDPNPWCGSGEDGDHTEAGTLTLTRDAHYDTLINNGTIELSGFRLFAHTLINNGTIQANGTPGTDATGTGPWVPGVGGAGAPNGSVGGGTDGGDGGAFGGNDGAIGNSASNPRAGSLGADGDDSAANTGGTRGSAFPPTDAMGGLPRVVDHVVRGYVIDTSLSTARIYRLVGGTGGGGGASNVSGSGGGGGGGGGIAIVSAGSLTNTGTIEANGGAGGAGISSIEDGGYGGAGAVHLIFRNIFDTGTVQTLNGDGSDGENVIRIRV